MYHLIMEGTMYESQSIEELAAEAADFVRAHICDTSQIIDIDLVDNDYIED